MNPLDYFTKPKGDVHLYHDVQKRRESYENRVSNAVQLLLALGAALAMIGTDTFGQVVHNSWDRMVPLLFLGTVVAAILLGSALVGFRYEARKLTHGYGLFDASKWPGWAEFKYEAGVALVHVLAVLLVTSLIWGCVSPPSEPSRSNPGTEVVSPIHSCPPVPLICH